MAKRMSESLDPIQSLPAAEAHTTSVVADISREIVKAHAQYYGRGPTKARTVWKEDVVVVILEEIFTRAERTLVDAGHFDQVRATRQAFQDEVAPLLCQMVEQATGREVRSFLSQVNPDGIAAEVFVLVRRDTDGSAPPPRRRLKRSRGCRSAARSAAGSLKRAADRTAGPRGRSRSRLRPRRGPRRARGRRSSDSRRTRSRG